MGMIIFMDDILRQRLANQLASGNLTLFTGAGFSLSARNSVGGNLPTVTALREILWSIAFPGTPFEESSTLGDIYEVASHRAGGKVGQMLKDLLLVDSRDVPEIYRKWFSFPWHRIYTLNIDDLEEAVQRAYSLPRKIQSTSALTSTLPNNNSDLQAIHLNGRVSEYPEVTFSPRQYGVRTARQEPWYSHLVTDLLTRPILFVGTVLDEPLLWQHIELRRTRNPQQRELRPGSYLVTPGISAARKAMLDDFNIKLIEMTQEEFLTDVLEKMEVERLRGFTVLSSNQNASSGGLFLHDVSNLVTQADDGESDFLLGRQPYWNDITSGRAVKRYFEKELKEKIETGGERVVILTGTAGSGKSTTVMRLALELQADGKNVGWLDSETDAPLWKLKSAVNNSEYQVLVIDDADNFRGHIGPFLADLASENPELVILAAMRTTRYDKFQVEDHLRIHNHFLYVVPHLENADIELLLQALSDANRLGYLRGLSHEDRVRLFQKQSGRQLLVAMIQATSNEKFEEKIDSECRDLPSDLGLIYCIVALATNLRGSLTRDEIMLASGDPSNEQLNRIQRLLNQHLLISTDGTLIRLRHRVVAERAVDYYRREGMMREPIQGLLWAIATKAHPELPRKSREQGLLFQLMNHGVLIRLTSDRLTPRLAYAQVENLLGWNYHYYLQRGSYEVENGELDLAKNFLDQARSMAPDDYLVQTEWAYMTLKRAAMNAGAVGASDNANEAFTELEDAIDRRGESDFYPYHVLGSQGLSWARRAMITSEEKANLLKRIQIIVKQGVALHPKSKELQQLSVDLERERLLMSVPPRIGN